ncbi:acyltransferase family protein [Serratia ureilytica]|jgi:surface polysaccharide O-acyltransferase-like enzyme|nr:acyltransferase family protein [Serratia ureilytica]KLE40487.1 hypothetical protein ABA78_01355 [Serratia sp. TEL]MBH1913406.1 acyltransferase family protein [Serratia ureilytica]BEL93737.1 membrane protein [Serratia marcescens]
MRWFNNARVIAILAVVLLHVSSRVVMWSELGSNDWWYANLYDSLVRWCVPVFVMISGALLLSPEKAEPLGLFYKKRASRILFPLVFWSLFYMLWDFLRNLLKGESKSIQEIFFALLSGKPYFHMWFLFMILGLYFVTPFIRQIVAASGRKELWLLSFALLAMSCLNSYFSNPHDMVNSSIFIVWFIPYVPYFILGYLLKDQMLFSSFVWLFLFIVSVAVTALWYYYCAINVGNVPGLYPYTYLSITVIIMSISTFQLLKKINIPLLSDSQLKTVANLTLGVYLIHPILLDISNALGLKPVSYLPLITIPLATIVVFFLSLGCAFVCSKLPLLKRTI